MSLPEIKIQKLEDSGKYLFVFSDKYNLYFIFQTSDDGRIYKIITDKLLNIESIDEIEVPDNFTGYKNIKFYKPFGDGDTLEFIGIAIFDTESYKFKIEREKLVYTETIKFTDNKQFNLLSSMKDIELNSYIQKRNKLYFVGNHIDREADTGHNDDAVYGVINIEKDSFEQIYYLYSDSGDIVLHSINTDTVDEKVYIAGWVNIRDERGDVVDVKPYFEMFVFR